MKELTPIQELLYIYKALEKANLTIRTKKLKDGTIEFEIV